jgi:hypothetical protein
MPLTSTSVAPAVQSTTWLEPAIARRTASGDKTSTDVRSMPNRASRQALPLLWIIGRTSYLP